MCVQYVNSRRCRSCPKVIFWDNQKKQWCDDPYFKTRHSDLKSDLDEIKTDIRATSQMLRDAKAKLR